MICGIKSGNDNWVMSCCLDSIEAAIFWAIWVAFCSISGDMLLHKLTNSGGNGGDGLLVVEVLVLGGGGAMVVSVRTVFVVA